MSRLRAFFASWVDGLAADGDGPPNWLWPSILLLCVIALEAMGIYFSAERAAFIERTQDKFLVFVGGDITVWLGYSGWKAHKASQAPKE
jgi:hypothetical protein